MPANDSLPPPTRCPFWATFLGRAVGTPLAVAGALALVWGAVRISGGGIMPGAGPDMATVLFWLGVIVLLYPAMLWVWVSELREGPARVRAWEGLSDEGRQARIAAQAANRALRRRGRARKGDRP